MKNEIKKIAPFTLLAPLLLWIFSIILDYHGSDIKVFNNFLNKPTTLVDSGGGTAFFYSWRDYLSFQFKWYAILIILFGGAYCMFTEDNKNNSI